ncbi:MAG: hypothetical protein CMJ64_10295 [Planctomycetaceae bacterium]|nr:hypothetical protein [Planctomycetaceae bacterium]
MKLLSVALCQLTVVLAANEVTVHHGAPVRCVAVSRDARRFASYGIDQQLRLWAVGQQLPLSNTDASDDPDGSEVKFALGQQFPLTATAGAVGPDGRDVPCDMEFSPDDRWLVLTDMHHRLRVWRISGAHDGVELIREDFDRDGWLKTSVAFSRRVKKLIRRKSSLTSWS